MKISQPEKSLTIAQYILLNCRKRITSLACAPESVFVKRFFWNLTHVPIMHPRCVVYLMTNWKKVVNVLVEYFMRRCNSVADLANNKISLRGESTSAARVPYLDKWKGCDSHQLNTAMKHTMQRQDVQKGIVWQELSKVKTLVATFKHTSWNGIFPTGFFSSPRGREQIRNNPRSCCLLF